MSAILHRRLHGHSSHLSSTSQHHQLRLHRLIKETMASIHDQLQCCLLFPKTNENKEQKHQQHTRDPRRRQTKHCRSQHKNQRPTVSANPHPPMEDRRVRQAKRSSVQNTQTNKLHIRGVTNLERDYIVVPRKLSFRYAIY